MITCPRRDCNSSRGVPNTIVVEHIPKVTHVKLLVVLEKKLRLIKVMRLCGPWLPALNVMVIHEMAAEMLKDRPK